ncbi:MAG: glycosyltransferase family 4 protein [Hyphomicrobiales bacterium]|nr:glycosyltransferase family 4 protein [Hyphomicrobiales bacterium]
MRIAFYAPLKHPDHPVPSGDREMGRLLGVALQRAGFHVEIASRFRSFDGHGDHQRQIRIQRLGQRLAHRLVRYYQHGASEARPRLWFTYHVYHKAPDWLGPHVSRALGIPYVIAEASHAPKQSHGPWAHGHTAAQSAISQADLIIGLNSADAECVLPLLDPPSRWLRLRPFMDVAAFNKDPEDRSAERQSLANRYDLDTEEPLLITVAMMRPGAKLASYRLLARALTMIVSRPWRLLVIGDGPARQAVMTCLAPIQDRVIGFGQLSPRDIHRVLAASDLFVWPAIDEAYGMALLEAQAAGVPCVAGRTGGVPDVVCHNKTGLLVPINHPEAFAQAVSRLLDHPTRLQALGAQARENAVARHSLDDAATRLGHALDDLIGKRPSAFSTSPADRERN